jgi:hypothetical protein
MSDDDGADTDADPFPAVPADSLDGWTLVDRSSATRFELPTMAVREHTLVYEDDVLRESVREATGVDRTWRFLFASALTFDPPLPPVTGAASMYPTVAAESRDGFAEELHERGVRDLERERTERTRSATGDRVQLTAYRGRVPTRLGRPVDVAGWLGVWLADGRFRLAGGGYPEAGLDVEGVESGATYRDALLSLIREVR